MRDTTKCTLLTLFAIFAVVMAISPHNPRCDAGAPAKHAVKVVAFERWTMARRCQTTDGRDLLSLVIDITPPLEPHEKLTVQIEAVHDGATRSSVFLHGGFDGCFGMPSFLADGVVTIDQPERIETVSAMFTRPRSAPGPILKSLKVNKKSFPVPR